GVAGPPRAAGGAEEVTFRHRYPSSGLVAGTHLRRASPLPYRGFLGTFRPRPGRRGIAQTYDTTCDKFFLEMLSQRDIHPSRSCRLTPALHPAPSGSPPPAPPVPPAHRPARLF